MARYRMDDGTIVDTTKAKEHWPEARDWNGSNAIGRSSGSQWYYEYLYLSRKGRYYIVWTSCIQGDCDEAYFVSPKDAAKWLLLNEHELPDDLIALETEVSE